jgi:hypothetical protein
MGDRMTYTQLGIKRVNALLQDDKNIIDKLISSKTISVNLDVSEDDYITIEFGMIGYLLKEHQFDVYSGNQYPFPYRTRIMNSKPRIPSHLLYKVNTIRKLIGLKEVKTDIAPKAAYDVQDAEDKLQKYNTEGEYTLKEIAERLSNYGAVNDACAIAALCRLMPTTHQGVQSYVDRYPSFLYQSPSVMHAIPFAPDKHYDARQIRDMTLLEVNSHVNPPPIDALEYLKHIKESLLQSAAALPIDHIQDLNKRGVDYGIYGYKFMASTTTAFNILTYNIATIANIANHDTTRQPALKLKEKFITAMRTRHLSNLLMIASNKSKGADIRINNMIMDQLPAPKNKITYIISDPPSIEFNEWNEFMRELWITIYEKPILNERQFTYSTLESDLTSGSKIHFSRFNTYDIAMHIISKKKDEENNFRKKIIKQFEFDRGHSGYFLIRDLLPHFTPKDNINTWMTYGFIVLQTCDMTPFLRDVHGQLTQGEVGDCITYQSVVVYIHTRIFGPLAFSAEYKIANPYIKLIIPDIRQVINDAYFHNKTRKVYTSPAPDIYTDLLGFIDTNYEAMTSSEFAYIVYAQAGNSQTGIIDVTEKYFQCEIDYDTSHVFADGRKTKYTAKYVANFKVEADFKYNDNIAQSHISHQSGSGLLWDDDHLRDGNTAQGGNLAQSHISHQSGSGLLWDDDHLRDGNTAQGGNLAQSNSLLWDGNITQSHISHQSGSGLLWDGNTAQGGNPAQSNGLLWDGNTAQGGNPLWDGNTAQGGNPLWDGNTAQSNGLRSDDGFTPQTHHPVDTNIHPNDAIGIPFGDGTLLLDSNLFSAPHTTGNNPLIDPLDQVHSGWIQDADYSTDPASFFDPMLTALMKSPDNPGNQELLVLNNDGSSQSIDLSDPNLLRFGHDE